MIVAIGIVPLTALFILVVIAVLSIRCNPLHLTGRGGGVQYSFIAVLGFIGLFGCSINPQQLKPQREGDAYPEGRGIVCAVRAGDRQNYWNEQPSTMVRWCCSKASALPNLIRKALMGEWSYASALVQIARPASRTTHTAGSMCRSTR